MKCREMRGETYLARFGIDHAENGLQPLEALADVGIQGNSHSHGDREVEHDIEIEHIFRVDSHEEGIEKIGLAAGLDPL